MAIPAFALYGEFSPFLATAQYLVDHLPNCRSRDRAGRQASCSEENPPAFLALLRGFVESLPGPEATSGPVDLVSA